MNNWIIVSILLAVGLFAIVMVTVGACHTTTQQQKFQEPSNYRYIKLEEQQFNQLLEALKQTKQENK